MAEKFRITPLTQEEQGAIFSIDDIDSVINGVIAIYELSQKFPEEGGIYGRNAIAAMRALVRDAITGRIEFAICLERGAIESQHKNIDNNG